MHDEKSRDARAGGIEEGPDGGGSLDPPDWEEARRLGHRMVDDMLGFLRSVRDRPAWRPIPPEAKAAFGSEAPRSGTDAARVYEEFKRTILPYGLGNVHPRFWGWVIGTGTPIGMLADLLASGLNSNLFGGEQAAAYVEAQVVDWFKSLLGFPAEAGGLLVTGGSAANLIGLAVARDARLAGAREGGLRSLAARPTVYASAEVHNSVDKVVALLGLGTTALRKVRVDDGFRIDVPELERMIAADRDAGCAPFCVVGNAGAVATGALDPLDALADLCEREKLWLHVDGAFGSLAALSPALRPLLRGMERAHSLAFDLHKWLCMPYDVGCVIVRDREAQARTFAAPASYLAPQRRGVSAGPHRFGEQGLELSRGFRALKVWMSLKTHGVERYARLIERNVAQARYLADLVEAAPDLELLAPVVLNIVCFRYAGPGIPPEGLEALNRELLLRLQETGVAVPSSAVVRGATAIRVAIANHRSRREDFDALVAAVRRIGSGLATERLG